MKKKFILFFIFLIISFFSALLSFKIIYSDQYSKIQNTSASSCENNASNSIIKDSTTDTKCFTSGGNVIITIPEYLYNMQCKEYIVQKGETLNSIAKNYVSTCPTNCSVKLIKEASKINNADSISAGTKIYIPETILKNGYIHVVQSGDTWSKLCRDYYPIYDITSMTNLLIFINDLPNNSLSIGDEIYLPNINI
ncbi:LysM domain-containing protein [Clostridium sp. SM-530-WT-3G]|uniref:LysM peptidoglycan-binding domain-containing protein n=1 Tax=Clostridium sp. SM-530-WT-3G TaxID=2725303 RepID=UPI00145E64CE|nr:LysM domain-containing protein [Clostridium sp. SM-530-WT-3G]NME82859.1 LysM peptidoglycan-binding domain-containing protein [Clostridium sp. SM-530-WT-3G]